MRRRGGLAAALAAVLLLAGCASLPTSGPVETPPAVVQQDDPGIVFQPNGPAANATPENIVRGFVQAASAGDGYTVAKEFLTESFRQDWKPDELVYVHTAPWAITARGDDHVNLSVPTSARVESDGVYTPSERTVALDFRLEQVRGQWRIAHCPDAVVLAQPAFLRVFKYALLQYYDLAYQRFVPDRRWFPVQGDEADAVRALLAGQAKPLQGVTRSAFPEGTRLLRPVAASGGRLAIDVAVPGDRPDERTTDRMQQQLAASISSLTTTGISTASISLSVDGRTVPAAEQAKTEQQSATDPVVVAGDRFGTLTPGGTVQEDRELGPRIVALDPRAVTVSSRQRLAAVLSGQGRVAVVDRQRTRVVDQRAGLIAPTLDQRGWTYSVPAGDPTGLRATDSSGDSRAVPADLGGTAVDAIEVSSDGTRMLFVHETGSGPEAYVAGIERDADGAPIGLTSDRYPVALSADGAIDATWVDQATVAVLTSGTSTQDVVLQQLGGVALPLAPLSNARQIVGATGQDDLRALLGTQTVVRYGTSAWTQEFPAQVRVDVLAVQR